MCGICGKLNYASQDPVDPALLQSMMNVMGHRGPDGQGRFSRGPIGLGHLRLSIIDLSASGTQPMSNEDDSVWIVFNGEIYNFQDLRCDLLKRGHRFRSGTDTEVIVHLYEEYGPACVDRMRGMFAFAIWDIHRQSLLLARDRVGIKPLYYCDTGKSLLFASELKSILMDPEVRREIDPLAIDRFLAHYYVPGNATLFRHIRKLEPGHLLQVGHRGVGASKQYWDLQFRERTDFASLDDASAALSDLLRETVRLHMISDVPVGILLSGGVDSTGVLSYSSELTDKKIKTFTVGFEGQSFADERPYARLAASRFATDHYEISMNAGDFRDFLPRYVWHMEEPVCEPPAVALYYVSKLARQHVTVLLSGEGGDEAFGGYPEYRNFLLLEKVKNLVGPMAPMAGRVLSSMASLTRSGRAEKYAPLLTVALPEHYLSRSSSPYSRFNQSRASLYSPEFLRHVAAQNPNHFVQPLFKKVSRQHLLNQMLYIDTKTWLPDDLLIKADKITMANSLELRVPLLDHVLLEFAASLPPSFKVQGRETKRVLKHAFASRIPSEIIHRKKTGFPVPYGIWLNGELRSYVADTLTSQKALNRGLFQRQSLQDVVEVQGRNGHSSKDIFSLLVLELWHRQFVDSPVNRAA